MTILLLIDWQQIIEFLYISQIYKILYFLYSLIFRNYNITYFSSLKEIISD